MGINIRNYQKELDALLEELKGRALQPKPGLMLHACCAPCLTYVLEYLSPYFAITVFFYNPNIFPQGEYIKRRDEAARLTAIFGGEFVAPAYRSEDFSAVAGGMELYPEGGVRCRLCYALRLEETAKAAAAAGMPYFGTTLSISPHKNAAVLNEIGEEIAGRYGMNHLPGDFKKREGYKRSIELSKKFNLYRQNYCGCIVPALPGH